MVVVNLRDLQFLVCQKRQTSILKMSLTKNLPIISWMIILMKLMILVLTRMQMPEMVLRRLLHTQEAERRGAEEERRFRRNKGNVLSWLMKRWIFRMGV